MLAELGVCPSRHGGHADAAHGAQEDQGPLERRPAQVWLGLYPRGELQTAIIDPLKDFATKSTQIVKKCAKPNRKGASVRCAWHARCQRARAKTSL